MPHLPWIIKKRVPMVVGSFGCVSDLQKMPATLLGSVCDIAEIRMDIIVAEKGAIVADDWAHFGIFPILFTARRQDEGGALALTAAARMDLLRNTFARASLIDLEVASIAEMAGILAEMQELSLPWIASFHDFKGLPSTALLEENAQRARDAGASAFKIAAWLTCPQDLARLADFQLADHGIPVACMGMGPLAAVSRMLCAQCGSVLNYGAISEKVTAPGQWESLLLKQVMNRLVRFPAE